MTTDEQLAAHQDDEHDLALLRGAIQARSVTGAEANCVAYLEPILQRQGFAPARADFLPGRPNLWGERGPGGGRRLLITGHTDTVNVAGWAERWRGDEREDPCAGAAIDGKVWGRGSADLKGGICAALAAVDLIDRAGIELGGELAFAFVGDEESGEPGSGRSAGIAAYAKLIERGELKKPDFAIYVEPTELGVYTSQIGFFIADVEVTGKAAYFGKPEDGVDAIVAMHAIQAAIFAHAAKLEARPEHPLVGRSGALITHLGGGGYIAVPERCALSLIRKLQPGEKLGEATAAFEAAVAGAKVQEGIKVRISYPAGRDHELGGTPAEIDPELAPVKQLREAIGAVTGAPAKVAGAPYWSEMPFLTNRIGCPAVYCAPGDIGVAHTVEECIEIRQYLQAVRAFALFYLSYLGAAS